MNPSNKDQTDVESDTSSQANPDIDNFIYVSKSKRFALYDFRCNCCDEYVTNSLEDMLTHMTELHPSKKLYCHASVKWFAKKRYGKFANISPKPFECPNCPSSFTSLTNFRTHKRYCCKKFVCILCQYTNIDHAYILNHIKDKHKYLC